MVDWIYEWDSAKDTANVKKHGYPLGLAILVFQDNNRTEVIDDRQDYGETRYLTYGLIDDRVFCACYTVRGNVRRIISFRTVHKKEKGRAYDNYQND